MRVGGGKAKGSAFERRVCEMLSLWITDGARRDCFWRSSISGGRATVGLKRGLELSRQAGDISSVSPEGHLITDFYYLECKHYRNLRLDSFVLADKGPLAQFWRETVKAAAVHKREPVLIAKGNHVPILVLTLPKCKFNPNPIAHIRNCTLGMFDWILKEKFNGAQAGAVVQHRQRWIRPRGEGSGD